MSQPYVLIIGGTNMDVFGQATQSLVYGESNIGTITTAYGGVGRNIAENCARLNLKTILLSALGADAYGHQIRNHAQTINLNMEHCVISDTHPTATYLSVLDENNDLLLGINAMDVLDLLDVPFIQNHRSLIENAHVCVLDTNLPQATLDYLLTHFKNTRFFVDGVSSSKVIKIKPHLHAIDTLKINKNEAQVLMGTPNDANFLRLAQKVRHVVITFGKDGALLIKQGKSYPFAAYASQIVNTTGAGDAFLAGLIYGIMHDYDYQASMHFALASAAITLKSKQSIHPEFSETLLLKTIKEQAYV